MAVLSMGSAIHMKDQDIKKLWKPGTKIHVETSDNVVPLKKDQRQEYKNKLKEYGKEVKWKSLKSFYSHHMLFEVTDVNIADK